MRTSTTSKASRRKIDDKDKWTKFLTRSRLSDEDIVRIDTEYVHFKRSRVNVAHPTRLLGEDNCDHEACSDRKEMATYIKEHQNFNNSKKKTVDLCWQACHAAALLAGGDIL